MLERLAEAAARAPEGVAVSPWALLQNAGDGIAASTCDGRIVFASDSLAHLAGHAAMHTGSSIFAWFDAPARTALDAALRAAVASGAPQRTTIGGAHARCEADVVLRPLAAGADRLVVWCFTAAHGRAGRELGRVDLRGAQVAQAQDFGFCELDVLTDTVHWWSDWCEALNIDPCLGDGHRLRWAAQIHPDDTHWADTFEEVVAGRTDHYQFEYRGRTRTGAWRWVITRGLAARRDAHGRALRIDGMIIDIDARKRMEIALHTQALILETMREGVVLLDESGRIEFTNPAFNRMFGTDAEGLRGTHVWSLLNLRIRVKTQRHALERLIRRVAVSGGRRTILLRRLGRAPLATEVLSGMIELNGERRILCVVQDVSERKRLEREISDIAYLERRRLGSDLHDGLGQELTGIALMLRSLAQTSRPAPLDAAPRLDEIIGLMNHAIQSTRQLASGLAPVTLTRGGLVAALHSLADWSRANYGIDARLKVGLRCALAIDESSATHLYLIAQEAIANACKHGRAATVTVTLRVNDLFFSLSITDDGAGFEPGRSASGSGIKIMRYRAGAIGGSLQIKRRRSGGTRVHCVCAHAPASAAVRGGAHGARQGEEPAGADW